MAHAVSSVLHTAAPVVPEQERPVRPAYERLYSVSTSEGSLIEPTNRSRD